MSSENRVEQIRAQISASADTILGLTQQVDFISRSGALLIEALRDGGAVLTAGNGGSAAEAMHMAEELTGRFRGDRRSLPGISLNADGTLLTCIGNDYGFDAIFARQIEGLGRAGDVLVLFSTSGKSSNLARALEAARGKNMRVIGLLGQDGGALAGLSDIEILVQGASTERIQEAHQVVMHIWLDAIEAAFPANTGGDDDK